MRSSTRYTLAQNSASDQLTPLPLPSSTTRILRSQTKTTALLPTPSKITKPNTHSRRKRSDPWTTPNRRPKNPNPKPRAPPATHHTCRICIDSLPLASFPTWIPPRRQRYRFSSDVPMPCIPHLARSPQRRKIDPACKSCIGKSMAARLDTLGARSVGNGCLEPGCQNVWSWEYVVRYLPPPALEAYNLAMLDVWRNDSPIKPITCIAPDCSAIGLPDTAAQGYPQVSCHACALRFCAQCLIPWHKDVTCAEHASLHVDAQMSDPEKDTLKLMQSKDGKRCPNCQLVIEKDGGCDSMFCAGCSKYFNWAAAGKSDILH